MHIDPCPKGCWPEDLNPWAGPLVIYDTAFPCPALLPSNAQLARLARYMKAGHPALMAFSLSVRCTPRSPYDPRPKLDPAEWKLEYPASIDVRPCKNVPDDLDRFKSVSLAIDDCLMSVNGQHPQSQCCLTIREDESDILGQMAYKMTMDYEDEDEYWMENGDFLVSAEMPDTD